MTIVIAVLIFSAFILVHELGHFLMARACGVTVLEFAIGMGPKIFGWTSKKTGTQYCIRLFPIGGFVGMLGEDTNEAGEGSLNNKKVWQRMLITMAGSIMNIVTGFLLMLALVLTSSSLGTTIVAKYKDESAVSYQSGLRIGDEIQKIGNARVHTAIELVYEIMNKGTKPIDVTIKRDGKITVLPGVKFPTVTESGIVYGQTDFSVLGIPKTPLDIVKHTWYQSISSIKMIWQSLFDLLGGKYGVEQVSGPVGVTQAIGEAASAGSSNLLYLCTLIAMNLGVFNLLPLPALDGGRMVFLVIEILRGGKRIKPEYEAYVHFAGIVALILFMIFITYKDVMKIILG